MASKLPILGKISDGFEDYTIGTLTMVMILIWLVEIWVASSSIYGVYEVQLCTAGVDQHSGLFNYVCYGAELLGTAAIST